MISSERLKKQEIALILLDIQMPDMDGFETAKRIKEARRLRGHPDQAGAVDYVCKPFDPEVLRMKVRVYVSLR